MDADFDGDLHDIDAPKDDDDGGPSEEEEEGDDDRIDQQMGEDLGDNQEVGRGWRTLRLFFWGDCCCPVHTQLDPRSICADCG